MLHLYCLTAPGSEGAAAGVRGLRGAPVRVVPAGAVHAWVSEHAEAPHPVTAETVREHDAVVRAALAWETPLPARFGQGFATEDALRRALAEREGALARALERVRGAVEMTVRVLLDDPAASEEGAAVAAGGDRLPAQAPAGTEVAEGGAGREYLQRLRARQLREDTRLRRAEFLQTRIARALGGVVLEQSRAPLPPSSRFLSISHLVAHRALSDYRLALRSYVDSEPGLRVLISGPWAPYSFAEPRGE